MTKIVILGDIHAGCRNSNRIVQHWQERFFTEVFWPYMKDNEIKRIIQLGDIFDNRKWLNINTLAWFDEVFVDPARDLNVRVDAIVGNHDIPYRYSLENNSPDLMLSKHDHINIWQEPGLMSVDGIDFTMLPWICKENEAESMEVIEQGGDICIGHLEINGFDLVANHKHSGGLSPSAFDNWNDVWSGHFHTQGKNGNIHYLGTPYQMTWSDYLPKFGFWVFDTHDRSLEFVENPLRYFHRITWEDGSDYDLENITESYVKLVVKKKTDFESFEKFIDRINYNNPFELKIIESFEEFSEDNIGDMIKLTSTQDLIDEYISDVATSTDKDKIKAMMHTIYDEAMQEEYS